MTRMDDACLDEKHEENEYRKVEPSCVNFRTMKFEKGRREREHVIYPRNRPDVKDSVELAPTFRASTGKIHS